MTVTMLAPRIIIPSHLTKATMRYNHSPSILILLTRIAAGTSKTFSSITPSAAAAAAAAWVHPPPITLRQFGGACDTSDAIILPSFRCVKSVAFGTTIRKLPAIRRGYTVVSSTSTTAGDNDNDKIINDISSSSTTTSSKQPRKQNAVFMPPLNSNIDDEHLQLAHEAMKFIDNSPDPFHAVQSAKVALELAGFVEWREDINNYCAEEKNKQLKPGGKYYFTRNKSTLVAFAIGNNYQPSNGFKIIGSHTDSPNLKIKPYSKRTSSKDGGVSGMRQLSVECYGGGLWHTWFDRDLGVSGRVFVREDEDEEEEKNDDDGDDENKKNDDEAGIENVTAKPRRIRQELVKIDRAILRIPNLAIHLQTASEREAFSFNKEDHLVPIISTVVKKSLGGGGDSKAKSGGDTNISEKNDDSGEWMKHQEPVLLQLLASHLGVHANNIVDFELNLFDVQRASLGGAHSEFLHSARLDNLASCFLSLKGLIEHVRHGGLEKDTDISMIAMFDHEEVGSSSATGAGSPIVGEAVKRISHALGAYDPILYDRAIRHSFVLSVDQAHAVHPNYSSKHEKNHGPKMNGGMVIKRNSNQRYATNAVTGLIVREIARRAGLPPVQEFVVRNDCGCGSTIGPVISTNTGIRAIDMGCPQLSMHSIRETMGVQDLRHGLALFRAFFSDFSLVDGSIEE